MSSLITLGGILVLLAFGFWWAVNTGKRLNQAEALKERVDKVANVNEFNRREAILKFDRGYANGMQAQNAVC